MDSRIVTREIRREIWPALRSEGFQCCSGRTAWRQTAVRIWVVNFQSFSSYFSSVDGCTTFSFAVNLGIYIPALEAESKAPTATPKPSHCHLQRSLSKSINQPTYSRRDIWYVEPHGENVLDALADARDALLMEGIGWFHRFESNDELLRTLIEDEASETLSGAGIGARWSSRRKVLIGRFCLAIGQEELGLRVLREGEAEIQASRLQLESFTRDGRSPGMR